MNVDALKRDPDIIFNAIKETDVSFVASTPIVAHIPKHYISGRLGSMENNVRCIGIVGFILDSKYYATLIVPTTLTLSPDSVTTVTINEVEYLEMSFDKGSTIMTTDPVKNGPLVYDIYNDVIEKGKTPWYFDYNDQCRVFDAVPYHASVNLGADHAIYEVLAGTRGRYTKDKTRYARNIVKSWEELSGEVNTVIPLRSVAFGATNATSRLLGSYASEGMTSALINQTDNLESVEELLLR